MEADAGHLTSLRTHFSDNALELSNTRIVQGIVGHGDGQAFFHKIDDPASNYGASACFEDTPNTARMQGLPCYALARLLEEEPILDMLHCDIQGAEGVTLSASMDALTARVRRVMVGIHSRGVEQQLLDAFGTAGWLLEDDMPCSIRHGKHLDTAPELLIDGLQVWRNRSL